MSRLQRCHAGMVLLISMALASACKSGITISPIEKPISPTNDIERSSPGEHSLGTPVMNNPLDNAAFGKDATGTVDLMYVGSSGFPSKLLVYHAQSGALLDDRDLSSIEAVWGLTVASDGSLYAGTANKKQVFRYVPGTFNGSALVGSSLTKIALPTGMEIIWAVASGSHDGIIYGGTSDSGKVFKYDPSQGVTPLNNDQAIVSGLHYIRSLAYANDSELYLGVGSPAQLIRFNPLTGVKTNITPPSAQSSYITAINYIDNPTAPKVLAKLTSGPVIVLDATTGALDKSLSGIDANGVSKSYGDNVYYTKGSTLYRYALSEKKEYSIASVGGGAAGYSFVASNGHSFLYAALTSGNILKYNLDTGAMDTSTSFSVSLSPTKIRSLVQGPSGRIYASGFLRGGLGIYDPATGSVTRHQGIGQAENMTTSGSSLYLGIYPGAIIQKFDEATPNPVTLFQDLVAAPYFQDRPFGMLAVPELNRLYVGSVPNSSHDEGAFAVYDIGSNPPVNIMIAPNLVDRQSIISLVYAAGKVFGGTTIYGGSNTTPAMTEAKLFVWNPSTNTKITEYVPAPGKKFISDLAVGPDGKIWGLAEGDSTADLFIVDPSNPDSSHTTIYPNKFRSISSTHWQGGKIAVRKDGKVYVSIGGSLYAVDAKTKDVKVMISSGVSLLATDKKGDLYYVKYETGLYKYELP